ncbi:hypothetical protein [Lysobacter gummosus]
MNTGAFWPRRAGESEPFRAAACNDSRVKWRPICRLYLMSRP